MEKDVRAFLRERECHIEQMYNPIFDGNPGWKEYIEESMARYMAPYVLQKMNFDYCYTDKFGQLNDRKVHGSVYILSEKDVFELVEFVREEAEKLLNKEK
jgi:hypothetical protein